ncbi:nucleolar protein 6 [Aphelenchoides avenae]|nr:nucleolar protein 6 [Aphelenchus avenae]
MLERISKSLASPTKILSATMSTSTEYDQFLRICVSEGSLNGFRKKFPAYAIDAYFDASYAFSQEVAKVLTRGWADRVRYFRFLRNVPSTDTRESSSSSRQRELTIVVGVKYTADWKNPVTRGPSADAPEAQAFRDFYGEKSQLRKFPDNAICEALIWCDEMDEHLLESVPLRIAAYLLKTSLGLHEASVTALWSYPADAISQLSSYQKLTKSYDKLSQALRKVKLPLSVVGVTCPSAYYRQTEPFPPEAPSSTRGQASVDNVTLLLDHRKPPAFCAALDVFVSLEHSGKWGDDPVVMGHLRTAFYIEMAQALLDQYGFVAKPMESSLVVLVESTTFILRIVDEREITSLEKLEEREPKAALLKTQNSKELRKRLVQQPLMCQQLHSVGQRLSGFPGACQLVKRWLASHYLSDILEEVAIELLVAKVFLDDVRADPPRSPFAGLCRFLELISTHDFLSQPVIVDLSDTFTEETAKTAIENFAKRRPVLPPLAIVTPDDPVGPRYTQSGPEPIMLKRLISLANIAYSLIRSNVSRARPLDFNVLLVHDKSVYDYLVLLDERQLVRCRDSLSCAGKSNGRLDTVPIVNYDPVERFIADIRHAYDSLALFCYDKYGGSSIGVILRPSQPRPINISSCAGRRKSAQDSTLVVNKDAFLEDIRIIGKGLVRDVVAQK